MGQVAQETMKKYPELVTVGDDGLLTVSELPQPMLVKAIQEQQQQIEQLKAIVCLDHPKAEICKT